MKNIFSKIKRMPKDIKFSEGESFCIQLNKQKKAENVTQDTIQLNHKYSIVVKPYMTQKSTGNFTFHDQWNNGVPMPSTMYVGTPIKETRGMYYFKGENWSGYVVKSAILYYERVNDNEHTEV